MHQFLMPEPGTSLVSMPGLWLVDRSNPVPTEEKTTRGVSQSLMMVFCMHVGDGGVWKSLAVLLR